jgi:hypothetical protein
MIAGGEHVEVLAACRLVTITEGNIIGWLEDGEFVEVVLENGGELEDASRFGIGNSKHALFHFPEEEDNALGCEVTIGYWNGNIFHKSATYIGYAPNL